MLAGFASGSALAVFCRCEVCGLAVAIFLPSAPFVSAVADVLAGAAVGPRFVVGAAGSDLARDGGAGVARGSALSLSRFEPNRVPSRPPPEVGAADATCTCAGLGAGATKLNKLPVLNPEDDSAGGRTWPGIVPEAVRISLPGPPFARTAARKVAFIPPCPPVVVATVGSPRATNCAIWLSSRRSLLRTADEICWGTL